MKNVQNCIRNGVLTTYVFRAQIPNIDERHFYKIEAVRNGWGVKELGGQYDSALYERLALSRDKEGAEWIWCFLIVYYVALYSLISK
ncbi:hypothetical protein ABID00_001024 [Faecalicatena orotica]